MSFLNLGIGLIVAFASWMFFRNRFLAQHGKSLNEGLIFDIPEGFTVTERRNEEIFLQYEGDDGDITISIATFVLPGNMKEREERVETFIAAFYSSLEIVASQVVQLPELVSPWDITWNLSEAVSPDPEVYARLHFSTQARGYVGVALVSEPTSKQRGLLAVESVLASITWENPSIED